jgi:hypothetical protein
MNTIYTFLENMFSTLPKTKEILKAKDDLYNMMIEKYEDLKANGKTENEAVGEVISEFGNITELLEELGVEVDSKDVRKIDKDEYIQFMHIRRVESFKIALGVALCIFAVALMISSYQIANFLSVSSAELIGGLLLIIPVIPAVGLFIASGLNLSANKKMLEEGFELAPSTKHHVELDLKGFQKTYNKGILFGVMTIMVSIISFILSIFAGYSQALVSLGLIFIALGVYQIVNVGVQMGGYNQLLKRGDYRPEMKKANQIIEIVAGIVFPLTAIGYLAFSFITGAWHISWIVWPIVGILFGIFAGTMEEIHKHKNK